MKQGKRAIHKKRLERECRTVRAMIGLYCRCKHHMPYGLCDECSSLLSYAEKRLEKCPFQGDKPACSRCAIHCYEPEMRERIREVMHFSGPKMIWHHPFLAIGHLLKR